MSDSSDDSLIEGDDYYAFLNIPRNATEEEISNAYRRLSRFYHPDKHQNPERKKEAEILFGKTKRAYEVLSDPHQRAIYDCLGVAGLATQGWEIIQRTKTPQEIREEYERLAREREELRLLRRTNPKSSASLTINATEIFMTDEDEISYYDFRDIFGLPHVEISGMALNQSIEAPLTSSLTLFLSGQVSSHNGRGSGLMSTSLRRVWSERSWAEVEFGAGSGLSLALKGFQSTSQGLFCNAAVQANVTPDDLRLGCTATVASHLDRHTVGYLTWRLGSNNGLSTQLVRVTDRMHGVCSVFFGLPHSFMFASYTHKLTSDEGRLRITGKLGTFGAQIEYSAEKKVSEQSHVSAAMTVGVPIGVHLKLRLRRATQVYTTNIILCDDLLPAPVVYGTLLPLLGWFAVEKLFISPFLEQQRRQSLEKQREANKTRLNELRREAQAAVELMRETVKRIIEAEENKKGLVIRKALYGRLVVEESEVADDVLDVTIPLQCLVKDSKLILQDSSKSQLPGFYDPCPGEEKNLFVEYLFHAVVHKVTIADKESLKIPKQSHKIT